MTTPHDENSPGMNRSRNSFFYRSLSPCSFERLRHEDSDYFYKPRRGPSTSKANITITRPIKTLETVTKFVELLSQNKTLSPSKPVESESFPPKFDDQKCSSQYSSLLSMDGGDLSSKSSSTFSSRSNSSICTVPEQDSHINIIEESPSIIAPQSDKKANYSVASCHVPAMGINITMTSVHLVLLELYPQNVDRSIIIFQRHLISLILPYEHEHWSISNVELQTKIEQEANFRFFSLTPEQFDHLLHDLQLFFHVNSSLASSLILNIALTGEQTNEYETKISSLLNKINLNFDIIQSRAESYIIGLDFFLRDNRHDELMDIFDHQPKEYRKQQQFYPYLLVQAESTRTNFYIVHSPNQYSILTSNNLCYKTYSNLVKLLQPGYDGQISSPPSSTIRRPPPVSFDLCQTSKILPSQIPLSSFTHLPSRCFPSDYSKSKTTHYIYRGWSNRRISASNEQLTTYDVHTQTDDSFLESSSSSQTRLAMHRSLSSMFTMNMALMLKLIIKLHPSIENCILTGEFFQYEKQAGQDLGWFIRSIIGENSMGIYQFKRQALISALGCALPRVYFDVIVEEEVLGND